VAVLAAEAALLNAYIASTKATAAVIEPDRLNFKDLDREDMSFITLPFTVDCRRDGF
jgi:hypothetical protein